MVVQPLDGPAVIEQWVDRLDAHDVDAALTLLADEPFLILGTVEGDVSDTFSGQAEVGEALQVYVLDDIRVRLNSAAQEENGTTFWTETRTSDTLRQLGIAAAEYVGEALVVGGKITSLIYTPTVETAEAIARATEGEPTGMPRSGTPVSDFETWAAWIGIGLWSVLAGVCLLVFNRRDAQRSA